jgi:chromosome segregation ATPase
MKQQQIERVDENTAKITTTTTEVREESITLQQLRDEKKSMEDYIAPTVARIAEVEAQIQEVINLGVKEAVESSAEPI